MVRECCVSLRDAIEQCFFDIIIGYKIIICIIKIRINISFKYLDMIISLKSMYGKLILSFHNIDIHSSLRVKQNVCFELD